MDISHFTVQLVIAIACGIIGNMMIPRQIPGRFLGLIIVGLVGVWIGEWTYHFLRSQYGLNYAILSWKVLDVPIIPSVIGSAIVIYVVTSVLRWGRYSR
jgi:uncharacterized membrane protein YeaQ/YmgE (transglycosylase-associated protein family)